MENENKDESFVDKVKDEVTDVAGEVKENVSEFTEDVTEKFEEQKKKNALGLWGMILAILGLIICWIPLLNVFAMVLFSVSGILSLIGLISAMKKNKPKLTSILGLVFTVVGVIVFFTSYAAIGAAAKANQMDFKSTYEMNK